MGFIQADRRKNVQVVVCRTRQVVKVRLAVSERPGTVPTILRLDAKYIVWNIVSAKMLKYL